MDKPKFGSPCNGCGYCCKEEVCSVGLEAFGEHEAPCVGLGFDSTDGKHYCSLVAIERRSGMKPIIAECLAIGKGCDSE
jgi:hypothetical protein